MKLTAFLAPYEDVLITCCLSFQVFRGSEPGYSIFIVCMCQYGDANSTSNWRYLKSYFMNPLGVLRI